MTVIVMARLGSISAHFNHAMCYMCFMNRYISIKRTQEALAIVLDVGPSMHQAAAGEVTSLETSLTAIQMILQRKLFAESKDEVALILVGTPETANELAEDDESYQNITVARPLGPVDFQLLQYVQNDVQPSDLSGDILDALVVTMDHIIKLIQGKRGFASKRIVLFTDCGGEFGDDQLDDIIGSIKEQEIEFNVIGPNLDDEEEDDDDDDMGARGGPSNGHVKERTAQQRAGDALLRHIIDLVDGESYSFLEALPALSFFQSRQVRPSAWKCNLEIGDSLQIPCCLYARLKEAKAKGFKNVYAKDPDTDMERLRTYHLNDEEETEIEKSDIANGFRYGSTLVPFSEEDKDAMKYQTEKCFKILGFTKNDNINRHHLLGDSSSSVVSEKGDEAAAVALSAFINALYETNTCAIVRRVYSKNGAVKLGCLVPHIKTRYECLIYNELPFSEDLRQFTFGSLPVKETNIIPENKKYAPTEEQLELMGDLIDTMDLTKSAGDEDEEALKPKLTFNPHLQRLYQCLQHRAFNPDDPLPELSAMISNYLEPPQHIMIASQSIVDKMQDKFKLIEVVKKKDDNVAGNVFKDADEDETPAKKRVKVDDDLEGGMAGIVKAKVTEVGTVTPVEDFKAIIGQKEEDKFDEACKMMQKRVLQLVMDSFGEQFYGKAMDCLKALRKETVKNTEPKMFNDFLKEFKESLANKGRKDFWDKVCEDKVGLITKMECEESGITREEADRFLEGEEEKPQEVPMEEAEDQDDLLAQL